MNGRNHKKHAHPRKPQPHPIVDSAMTFISFAYPLMVIPQLYDVWIVRSVVGVSLVTWTAFFVLSIPCLLYGLAHGDWRWQVMYGMWVFLNGLMVAGLLIFG